MAGINCSLASKDTGFSFFFDKNSADSVLKGFKIGEIITKIGIHITEVFGAGKTLSIGFPADHTELVDTTDIDLSKIGINEYIVYRRFLIVETLTAYFVGAAPATGKGYIYIEELN